MARALNLLSITILACATSIGVGTPAAAADPGPEVIPIDLLLAGSYTDAVRDAMAIWNTEVPTILSLPDLGPDSPCTKVMSGAWAGPDCVNDHPDAEEITEVTDFFAANDVGDPVPWWGGFAR